jgi:hypothetical protein
MPHHTAALSSLKTATEIVKFIRESDVNLEKAELKLKLADLLGSLADTKMELVEVQDTLIEKDKKIADLEEAFQSKDKLVRQNDAYYKADENGEPSGLPFCLRCWENDHRIRQLVSAPKDRFMHVCTTCGHQYTGHRSDSISPKQAN